jgi:hypothetical protein
MHNLFGGWRLFWGLPRFLMAVIVMAISANRLLVEVRIRDAVLTRAAIPTNLEAARYGLTALRALPGRAWNIALLVFHRVRCNRLKDRTAGPTDFQIIRVLRIALGTLLHVLPRSSA